MLSQEEVMRMLEERDAVAQASWDAYQEEHNAEIEDMAQRMAAYLSDGGMDYITGTIDEALAGAVDARKTLYVTFGARTDTPTYTGEARFNKTDEDWGRGTVWIANFNVEETAIKQGYLESEYDVARLLAEAVCAYYLENGWSSIGEPDKVYFELTGDWELPYTARSVRGYGFLLFDPQGA